jgi:hypothetical protein
VIREKRAQEIDRALRAHLDGGGGALFVTLTVRHGRGDELEPRLAAVSEALRSCLRGGGWERLRGELGYVGSIRAVEVTWGQENGWHPHVHAVLLIERPVGQAVAADVHRWLLGRWGAVCERRGFGTVSATHGVDVRVVDSSSAGELAGYLTKVEGGWGAGHELARGDVKRARSLGLVPVELLENLVETGESRWAALWREYERATFGKKAIVWSRGLRERLLGVEAEKSDEELAASEGMEAEFVRYLVAKAPFWAAVKAGVVGDLLSQIEAAAGDFWIGERDGQGWEATAAQAATGGADVPAGPRPDRGLRGGDGDRASPAMGQERRGRDRVDPADVPDLPGGAVALIRWRSLEATGTD